MEVDENHIDNISQDNSKFFIKKTCKYLYCLVKLLFYICLHLLFYLVVNVDYLDMATIFFVKKTKISIHFAFL